MELKNIFNKAKLDSYFPNNKLSVIFSAMSCSGKSTIAKSISKKFGLEYIDGGDAVKIAMKKIAIEDGFSEKEINKKNWWETEEGMKFLRLREEDKTIDERIDKKLINIIKQGRVVMTSWTMPWLSKYGVKIWLKVDKKTRIHRCMLRDNISFKDAEKVLEKRDKKNVYLYKKLYGFDYGKDMTPFDLVIDASVLGPKTLCKAVSSYLKELIKARKNMMK